MIVSVVAVGTVIGLLVYYNVLTPYYGLIYGVLVSFGTIVVETLIPVVMNYSIAPKVSLKVDDIKLEKRTFLNVKGYELTALVTNKGKKIALNIDASIQIRNEENAIPNLLDVSFDERDDRIIHAEARETAFESDKYAWIDNRNYKVTRKWEQLRQNDRVILHFPYISHAGIAFVGDPVSHSDYDLIKLQNNTSYKITVDVKGEDAEKTTVCGHARKRITVTE